MVRRAFIDTFALSVVRCLLSLALMPTFVASTRLRQGIRALDNGGVEATLISEYIHLKPLTYEEENAYHDRGSSFDAVWYVNHLLSGLRIYSTKTFSTMLQYLLSSGIFFP